MKMLQHELSTISGSRTGHLELTEGDLETVLEMLSAAAAAANFVKGEAEIFFPDVCQIFDGIATSASNPAERTHLFSLCEDGKSLMVKIELADGRVLCASFCPGSPIETRVIQ